MLPYSIRIHGLRVALTIKHVQDDLIIVDDFDSLASPDPQVSCLLISDSIYKNYFLVSS